MSAFGQGIGDLGRMGQLYFPYNESVSLQTLQNIGERLLGDAVLHFLYGRIPKFTMAGKTGEYRDEPFLPQKGDGEIQHRKIVAGRG